MKSRYFFLLLVIVSTSLKAERRTKTLSIKFDTDSFVLSPPMKSELTTFLASLDLQADYQFEISGHTDDVGSDAYNINLSAKRTASVRAFLLNYGIHNEVLKHGFHGERKPLTSNTERTGKALNRRVDLTYSYIYFQNISELLDSLRGNNKQVFTIDPTVDNIIRGKQGVKVFIPANSLCFNNGVLVEERVKVGLMEALKMKDFVANQLATASKNNLLQSGGMVKLEANLHDSIPLELKQSSSLLITMPTTEIVQGMEVFLSDSGTDWRSTGQPISDRVQVIAHCKKLIVRTSQFWPNRAAYSNKPAPPLAPKKPAKPHRPRPEGYTPNISWHQALQRKRIEKSYADRYVAAVERYEQRMQRYRENLAAYPRDSSLYEERLANYKIVLREWEKGEKARELEEYKQLNNQYQPDLDKRRSDNKLNDVYAECDSLRKVKLALMNDRLNRMKTYDLNTISSYVLSVNELGWINCDKLISSPGEQNRELVVWDNDPEPKRVDLILPIQRARLSLGMQRNGSYQLQYAVPKDFDTYVFAYKVVDGKPHIFLQRLTDETNVEMKFTAVKFEKLKRILEGMNESKNLEKLAIR